MAAVIVLCNEQLLKAQDEIIGLKYVIALSKVASKAKADSATQISQLRSNLRSAEDTIRELNQALDTERSAVDVIRCELISVRQTAADLSEALSRDRSAMIELHTKLVESTAAANHVKLQLGNWKTGSPRLYAMQLSKSQRYRPWFWTSAMKTAGA